MSIAVFGGKGEGVKSETSGLESGDLRVAVFIATYRHRGGNSTQGVTSGLNG